MVGVLSACLSIERFAKAFFVVCIQTGILRIKRGVYFIIKKIDFCAKGLLKKQVGYSLCKHCKIISRTFVT